MMSVQDKLAIIHQFDERELREEVVMPVLRELAAVKPILTHGNDEEGKDIVTIEEDSLGAMLYTAFVIKAKRFSKSATPNSDRELLGDVDRQIGMAIVSGFDCPETGTHVQFHKIVILTNQALPQSARNHFIKLAEQHPHVSFQCIDDNDLRNWIDKYLPDLYYVKKGSLASYFQRLARKCAKLSEHQMIGIYKGEIRDIADVYVAPKLFRVQKVVKGGRATSKPVISQPEVVVEQRRHLLIVSGPGGGKSTLLRALAQQFLAQNRRNERLNVPVLVKALDLAGRLTEAGLCEAVSAHLAAEFGSDAPNVSALLTAGSVTVRLLIDGLDEISSEDDRVQLCRALCELCAQYPNAKVVVAARYAGDSIVAALSEQFIRWELNWSYKGIVKKFTNRWFRDKQRQDGFLATLREHDLMSRLQTTPLVLTLLAILYDFGQTDLPGSLPELYQMVSDLLLGKWSLDRRAATFHKETHKEYLLMRMASSMHNSGKTSISFDEFAGVVAEVAAQLGEDFSPEQVLHELVDISGLLSISDLNRVEFRHLSFQEFFTAKLIDVEDEDPLEHLTQLFANPWSSQVVYYYAGLKKQNVRLLQRLQEHIGSSTTGDVPRMILEFGYILQASYLSPIGLRSDAVITQIGNFGRFLDALVNRPDSLPEGFPTWVMVMAFVHMFSSTYRSGFWRGVEDKIVEQAWALHADDSFASVASRLLAALLPQDDSESADRLLELEPSVRATPILYLCLEAEVQSRLSDQDSPRLRAAMSSLHKLQQVVRQHLQDDPAHFASALMDTRSRKLAAAVDKGISSIR